MLNDLSIDDGLYKAILQIREAPALWIGRKSLIALMAFLNGYEVCEAEHSAEPVRHGWYDAFAHFVCDTCHKLSGSERKLRVIEAIHTIVPEDEAAYEYFFLLLDQFAQLQGIEEGRDSRFAHRIKSFRLGIISIDQAVGLGLQNHSETILGVEDDFSDCGFLIEWEADLQKLNLVIHRRDDFEIANQVIHDSELFLHGSEEKDIPPCIILP